MAKDDYYVIAYKVLLYYYGCLKRKYMFDEDVFWNAINRKSFKDIPNPKGLYGEAPEPPHFYTNRLIRGGAHE